MLDQSVNIWFAEKRDKKVVLKVHKDAGHFFKQRVYFPLQKIKKENKDGSLILKTKVCHYMEAIPTIFQWIPYVKVVEPKELKKEIRRTIQKDERLGKLRYQLLHGLAATLMAAKKADALQAIFVVYEFVTNKIEQKKICRNAKDFEKFAHALLPECANTDITKGTLFGPVTVEGGKFVPNDIPLLIGKIVYKNR